jgi:hypothetical protein
MKDIMTYQYPWSNYAGIGFVILGLILQLVIHFTRTIGLTNLPTL